MSTVWPRSFLPHVLRHEVRRLDRITTGQVIENHQSSPGATDDRLEDDAEHVHVLVTGWIKR